MTMQLLSLRNFVWLAGLLQFCQIPAMIASPKMLNWKEDLAKLSPINRNIVLVIGAAIVLTGVGLGVVVVVGATEMVGGGRLGTALCGFLGVFWLYRDAVQVFIYRKIWPKGGMGTLSHCGLTALFTFQAAVYLTAFVLTLHK
jgi:hypothetical protein